MSLESENRIQSLIAATDTKTGAKNLNLRGALQALCDGYPGTATAITMEAGNAMLQSGSLLRSLLASVNSRTGQNDPTLTDAVHRLCLVYNEPEKLYSFGVLSDLHIQYATGVEDLQRALTYLKDRVAFTCVCGDLVSYATTEHMAAYKACVTEYAGDMPLYECAGNHECYPAQGVSSTIDEALWTETTGKALFYSFAQGADVFLFLSLQSTADNNFFPDGALEWLENTLEANKNKRCFVFQHVPEMGDKSADPSGGYSNMLENDFGHTFVALMKRYPNTVWFHGHTHLTLGAERYPITQERGYRSVHIPSLVSPRFYDAQTNSLADYYLDENGNKVWGSLLSEGYIVDVYENKIILRGINFAAGENRDLVSQMLSEVYALDTTIVTV